MNEEDYFGMEVSMSDDGSTLGVGAAHRGYWSDTSYSFSGYVKIYQFDGSIWTPKGSPIYGAGNDRFGYSISLSPDGNSFCAGAIFGDNKKGYVKIFNYNGSEWDQKGQTINGEVANEELGFAVSLSENANIVAAGAVGSSVAADGSYLDRCGNARVFEFDGSSWVKKGSTLAGGFRVDHFGDQIRLSSDGLIMAVSAAYGNTNGRNNDGYVRVYQYVNSDWELVGNPGKKINLLSLAELRSDDSAS